MDTNNTQNQTQLISMRRQCHCLSFRGRCKIKKIKKMKHVSVRADPPPPPRNDFFFRDQKKRRRKKMKFFSAYPPLFISFFFLVREVVKKNNGYFTVRLTVRGGGVNPPRPDRSICEKFNTFFLWNMIP